MSSSDALLRVQDVIHAETAFGSAPAGLLLQWIDPQQAALEFGAPVREDTALDILRLYPPVVVVNGNRRSLVGFVELTAALLRCISPEQKIEVRTLPAGHPLANSHLPLYELIPITTELRIQRVHALLRSFGQRPVTQTQVAHIVRRDRSLVAKVLSQ